MQLPSFATTLLSLAASFWSPHTCKLLPSDPGWPSASAWATLNTTVDGHLIHYVPAGAVCSRPSGHYDAAACAALLPRYWTQSVVSRDPGLVRSFEYTNNSCDPTADPEGVCGQGYYPEYVVDAREPAHVAAAVNFARTAGIRLNVKNTGHDFNGRSTARGSLSVWLANWRAVEWVDAFEGSCGAPAMHAVTVTGGVQWKEMYAMAAKRDRVFVGGASGTVGVIGGYLQGGGHSPISRMFGLAVDNVLEFTVVLLSTGEVVTASDCTHTDLFWALRGGGGGTFGVVISATFRTFPSVHNVALGRLEINSRNPAGDITPWRKANAYFHSQIGRIADAGIAGYYFTLNDYTMHFVPVLLNGTVGQMDAGIAPVVARLQELAGATGADFTVSFTRRSITWAQYAAGHNSEKDMNIGFGEPTTGNRDTILGSRLIPRSTMEADPDAYMSVLMNALNGTTAVLAHLVAGGQVAANDELYTSVNPAWRTALAHVMLYHDLPTDIDMAARKAARVAMTAKVARLTALTPGSGSYLNECDVNQPNKADTFYGAHYPRLAKIKKRYDPQSVMWCVNCVGFEQWEEVDGVLCKARGAPWYSSSEL